ncbi:ABC transporter family substrate-binding protein [Streptomyces purpureus]|uniref:ABC transporter family substrate-binding protein n=1 Tax=Streptomyces purpureus TaxID=1951 RepID=UPI00379FDD4E
MSQVGAAPRGRTCSRSPRSRTLRSVALVTSGVLAVTVLAGCSSDEDGGGKAAPQDLAPAARDQIADGGTLKWAVDTVPATLNTFQADADGTTARIAGAVLPALYTLDARGRPQLNPDYLESAQIIEREPKQVVLYKLHQQAVWSDGREIGAPDFVAQWRALSGKDTAYWTARNAGYERIEKIERGANNLEVRVTFAKPYADWQSLFSPLYPKEVMGSPATFNDGARTQLKSTAGPFQLKGLDAKAGTATLVRNPRWWGQPAKLDTIVLKSVPRADRASALAAGTVDLAEIDRAAAERITLAAKPAQGGKDKAAAHGPGTGTTPSGALKSWSLANGSDKETAGLVQAARKRNQAALARYVTEQRSLRDYVVRKSLEPAYTQLSLNGESGPLADERVRRAVARALDRQALAETVLTPLGLPAQPPGSHLALAGQAAYADNSNALGGQDTKEAEALLADAGWTRGGARKPAGAKAGSEASPGQSADPAGKTDAADEADQNQADKAQADKNSSGDQKAEKSKEADKASNEGLYIVGDDKPGGSEPRIGGGQEPGINILAPGFGAALQSVGLLRQAQLLEAAADGTVDTRADGRSEAQGAADRPVAGAYAPRGTAAPAPAPEAAGPLGKNGQPLTLKFVLPSGPGSESLRAVGDKIVRMLDRVGIRTDIVKVPDENFFKDHVAAGEYDLALFSWPASAFPATDARPIYAKPEPASDGSLLVEQNYSRVGTDRIDQLFDQAVGELNEKTARDLVRQADARIWAAAGSIPLYQRPQLVGAHQGIRNAGAFGFATPRYQDIGWKKAPSAGGPKNTKK